MRFARYFSATETGGLSVASTDQTLDTPPARLWALPVREPRWLEGTTGMDTVLAPRDWPLTRIEAWRDWSAGLEHDL